MKNLELIYLIKATTVTSKDGDGTSFAYQYELHDFNGKRIIDFTNCGLIDKKFTRLRRKTGNCHAVRQRGGNWVCVDEQTYLTARLEYLKN